jgi:hypothetical protein
MKRSLLALSLIAFLSACGGGGSSPPDAEGPDAEATPDAGPACVAATFGAQDILDFTEGSFAGWGGPATADLGDGGDVIFQIEFYGDIETSLEGTFDLAAGNQANYQTCAICFRVFSLDAKGGLARQFFQSGGSVTLTADPLTGVMTGTVTDLELVEVTIDGSTFESTPVPGGACLDHDPLTLDADRVPNAWTCDTAAYDDGTSCDCGCAVADPDCDIEAAPVVGCDTGNVCIDAVCTETCDVLASPPDGCTTGTCGFYTATQDICYTDPAVVDAAAIDAACGTGTFCGVSSTVALGVCDVFANDDNVCRESCDATADCDALEVCSPIGGLTPKGLCITPAANDTCATATPIVVGTPVNGVTGGATADYSAGLEGTGCTGFTQAGPDVAYQLVLAADASITVSLSNVSPNFDPSVSLLGPGVATLCDADPIATCVAGADAGLSGDAETFTYAATAGTYFILVDAFGATDTGSYTLSVTTP